jgi:hypothetical protein
MVRESKARHCDGKHAAITQGGMLIAANLRNFYGYRRRILPTRNRPGNSMPAKLQSGHSTAAMINRARRQRPARLRTGWVLGGNWEWQTVRASRSV